MLPPFRLSWRPSLLLLTSAPNMGIIVGSFDELNANSLCTSSVIIKISFLAQKLIITRCSSALNTVPVGLLGWQITNAAAALSKAEVSIVE